MKCTKVCELVKKYLDDKGLSYDITSYEDSYDVFVRIHSKEFYLTFQIEIIEVPQIIVVTAKLPILKKSIEMSLATSAINTYLINGSFDYDIKEGITTYRIVSCWQNNIENDYFILYMLDKAVLDIDTYGIKLKDLAEDIIDLDQLRETI